MNYELKEEDIIEFQRIYKLNSGNEISLEDAKEMGLSLIGLISLVYGNYGKKDNL